MLVQTETVAVLISASFIQLDIAVPALISLILVIVLTVRLLFNFIIITIFLYSCYLLNIV